MTKYSFGMKPLVQIVALILLCTALSQAQTTAERSHVERFTTPKARAERDEIETTNRLKSNPRDDEALNLRANARMRLGRYPEALDDIRRAAQIRPSNAD